MKKILIMEDDNIIAGIYRNKFLHNGYEVEIANDGETGLEKMKVFMPDIVQLDLLMPKLNGVDVIKQIRACPEYRNLPIIVLSNSYVTRLVEEAWRAGATLCLAKSECTPKVILEKVEGLLAEAAAAAKPASTGVPSTLVPPSRTSGTVFIQNPDTAFQASVRKMFLDGVPKMIQGLRNNAQQFLKCENEIDRSAGLEVLFRSARSLSSNAGVAGMSRISSMAAAFEALLKELEEKPSKITPSTFRTCALAVDVLALLLERAGEAGPETTFAPLVLVVDDEAISRRSVVHGLGKAGLQCISLQDSSVALQVAAENRFGLIFLDVDMPGMTGFELCPKLRLLPLHKRTPIIFVTSYGDFENRAKSALSGGNDLITKPFLLMELAVKALAILSKSQLSDGRS